VQLKVPVLQELIFEGLDQTSILGAVRKHKVGQQPFFWMSTFGHREELENFLSELYILLSGLGISPKFPYPFYVVSHLLDGHNDFFPTVRKVEELPKYFKQKVRKLKGKELNLSMKCSIVTTRLNNLLPEEKIDLLQVKSSANREIYLLQKELDALNLISRKLDLVREEKKV